MIFCLGEGKYESKGIGYQKNNHAFNKQVTKERFNEIRDEIEEILKDFKLDARKDWSNEWKKVSLEQWKRIASISEFDKDVVEKIIDFELNLDEEMIEINGKKWSKDTIAEALRHHAK